MVDVKVKSTSNLLEGVGERASTALGGAKAYPARVQQFFHDVRLEMRHVTWPSGRDVRGTTLVVLVTTLFFGAFFWVCDLVFGRSIDYLLRSFK